MGQTIESKNKSTCPSIFRHTLHHALLKAGMDSEKGISQHLPEVDVDAIRKTWFSSNGRSIKRAASFFATIRHSEGRGVDF